MAHPAWRDMRPIDTGTIGDLYSRKSTCKLCTMIWNALKRNMVGKRGEFKLVSERDAQWELKWDSSLLEYFGYPLYQQVQGSKTVNRPLSALYPVRKGENVSARHAAIRPLSFPTDTETDLSRYCYQDRPLVGTTDAEAKLVKSWISACQYEHGPLCR